MRSFITGIEGFVGTHLTRALKGRGDTVWGICHPALNADALCREYNDLKVRPLDLMDPKDIREWIRRARPERVYHLAAQSHVPTSWEDPEETFRVNVLGTLNLLRAVTGRKKPPRVLLVSSGDIYGDGSELKGPINEKSPIKPMNPYAASKASAEWMALSVAVSYNIGLVIVRPFNHIGPGQKPSFVVSDFARQIARIEAGLEKPVVRVGNLDAKKDFTDVRDMVWAYSLALEKCPKSEVFNICRGKSCSIKEILTILIDSSSVSPKIVREKSRMRKSQSNVIRASAAKFRKLTGWKPKYSLRQTLKDTLDYWRGNI